MHFSCLVLYHWHRQIARALYPSTWHDHGCYTASQPSNVPTASCRDKTGSEPSLLIITLSSSGTLEKAWCIED